MSAIREVSRVWIVMWRHKKDASKRWYWTAGLRYYVVKAEADEYANDMRETFKKTTEYRVTLFLPSTALKGGGG